MVFADKEEKKETTSLLPDLHDLRLFLQLGIMGGKEGGQKRICPFCAKKSTRM